MKKKKTINPRLNRIGGEAVLEGVMMKAGHNCPTAVRLPNGAIRVLPREFHAAKEKHKWMGLPILRGFISFIETMKLSLSVMTASADVVLQEEMKKEGENPKDSGKLMGIVSAVAMLLGVALAIGLFIFLPNYATKWIDELFFSLWQVRLGVWEAVISGFLKIVIFISYIYLVSLMPDIKRTFQYHGAEHKTIACFEAGQKLTPANAKRHSRFHPRCGTAFMFVMIIIGVVISLSMRTIFEVGLNIDFEALTGKRIFEVLIYSGMGLLLLPLIMGLGYEFLMFAGKHSDNVVVKILSAPGLWMQRLTTREPSEEQLEVAIAATKYALTDVYPFFARETYASEEGYLSPEKKAALEAEAANTSHTNGNQEFVVEIVVEKDETPPTDNTTQA